MSLRMRGTAMLLRLTGRGRKYVRPQLLTAYLARRPAAATVPRALHREAAVHEREVDGGRVVTLTPRGGAEPGGRLLYLPGGAYVTPISGPHWGMLRDLLRATGVPVAVVQYPLAPGSTVADGERVVDAALAGLRRDGAPVVVAGDSAGGGLALALAQRLRDAGGVAPAGLLLIAPWVDGALEGAVPARIRRRDPLIGVPGLRVTAGWWAAGRGVRHPSVSPLRGDLSRLPPTLVVQGGVDVLAPDAERLVAGLRDAGSPVESLTEPGAFHVYPAATWTPEARRAIAAAAAFVVARLAAARPPNAGDRARADPDPDGRGL